MSAIDRAESRGRLATRDRYPVPAIQGEVGSRFLPTLAMVLFLWAVGWPFLTLGFVNHYGSPDADWIEALYQRKDIELRDSARRPEARLIVVGGSEALFGVDAELIQQKLGVTTINYGTHAGLGTYLLDRARRVLRPGDSVLLCPAYEIWYADGISDVEWDYFATYDKQYFWSSGTTYGLRTLYSVPGSSYYQSLIGWGKRLIGRYQDERVDYNVATMDPAGDLRGPIWPEAFRSAGFYSFPPISHAAGAVAEFREFAQWARQNHVRVFYSWPNCCRPDPPPNAMEILTPSAIKAMFDAWGFILLNDPGDTWFPRQWFVDTIYHPDSGCRRVRTEALIRKLRPYYGLPSAAPEPQAIYLVASRTWWLRDGNAFASQPNVWAKYLTPQKLDSPDAITPGELAEWAARGVPIWYDDPAIESLLPANQWNQAMVNRRDESLGDWLRRYPHHVFLLARARAGQADAVPLPADLLPPGVRSAMEGSNPAVAVMGTGPWSGITRVAANARVASIRSSLEKLVGRKLPHLAISLRAEVSSAQESRISANGRRFSASTDGQLCVVVIEPTEGVVADAATFLGGAPATVWWMKQLTPRQASPPIPAR